MITRDTIATTEVPSLEDLHCDCFACGIYLGRGEIHQAGVLAVRAAGKFMAKNS
jgi:hypothetical protein